MKNILLALTLLSLCTCQLSAQNKKPNFIIILADDLGYGDLGITGSNQVKTPNIDRLADEGVFFKNGYVSAPVCSPSRAGLITGRNQVKFGHDNNLGSPQLGFDPAYHGMPLSETTIASHLKKLGYTTGLIGKWHLGEDSVFHPLNRGFDEMWGYVRGGHDYFKSKPSGSGYLAPIECNYKTPQKITYLTDDKGDECVDFISRHKSEPFFLYASFNAPHTPMQATEDDLKLFKHIEDKKRRIYCAMIYRLDLNVGRIVKALEDNSIADNTVVVFLSDNGGPCAQNSSLNAPYNGQKGTLLEGGIHVPFIMRWKGTLPKNTVYDRPVLSLDIAPTFFELAGGITDSSVLFDGVNLIPYITNKIATPPHDTMLWRFTISASIRKNNWKLIRLPDRLPMLYDLSKDASEQNNVALDNLEITKELLHTLGYWDVRLPHPVFLEGATWRKYQIKLYDKKYNLKQVK
ncbi:MAG: sulfatase-like hydrolase/transferase [Bacteroidales bacterium]